METYNSVTVYLDSKISMTGQIGDSLLHSHTGIAS